MTPLPDDQDLGADALPLASSRNNKSLILVKLRQYNYWHDKARRIAANIAKLPEPLWKR